MPVRFAVPIAVLMLTMALPTHASADLLLGPTDGVSATRTGDTITVTFTPAAQAQARLKAGGTVDLECRPLPAAPPLGLSDGAGKEKRRSYGRSELDGDGVAAIELDGGARRYDDGVGPVDACDVSRLRRESSSASTSIRVGRVALTPAGETWLQDVRSATALRHMIQGARDGDHYKPLTALGAPGAVSLDAPDATPPAGQLGYWTDGAHAAVAAAGSRHRLVLQDLGDGMLRSDVLDESDAMSGAGPAIFGPGAGYRLHQAREDDQGPSPLAEGHPAQQPEDGVRSALSGRGLVVRFTGAAAATGRRLAGRRVGASCFARPAPTLLPVATGRDDAAGMGRMARRGGRVTIPLSGAGRIDVCLITDDGSLAATVAPTPAGRRWLFDLRAILAVFATSTDDVIAADGTAYRTTSAAVRRSEGVLRPMAGPDGPAPSGRVGLWTDGAHRATLAMRSASGRTYLLADEGDGTVRSNVYGELGDLAWLSLFGGVVGPGPS